MLLEPGDSALVEEPAYSGTLTCIRPLGAKLLPVATDHHGMNPASLRSVLSKFPKHSHRPEKSSTPKFLYTVPNGCNPTGASMTLKRKKEVYQIAREYDILIVEDDPYFYLQYSKPRLPSYLSMDTDGRVLRLDSFSKILSAGLRIGFVTGPQPLIERIVLHQMVSSNHPAVLAQIMVSELLGRWGIAGFERHANRLAQFYQKQKQYTAAACEKYLTGLAEWSEPAAGMFLWIKLLGVGDTKKLIEEKALDNNVSLIPGCAFMIDDKKPTPYVRASFSLAKPEQIDEGFRRLSELVKEEMKQ
jgi:kynurenine/2-aminoadipate aminotransferase